MEKIDKELSIGEVGVIHSKTVVCAKDPFGEVVCKFICEHCAFYNIDDKRLSCPKCCAENRADNEDVYYPEITKGL